MLSGALVIAVAAAAAGPARPWPGDRRADLEVPEELVAEVLNTVKPPPQRALGRSRDEMAAFSRDAHLLRTVEGFFRDAFAVPRDSGRIADELLAAAGTPIEAARLAYLLTDVSAGRFLPPPPDFGFGVGWLPADRSPADLLDAVLAYRPDPAAAGREARLEVAAFARAPTAAERERWALLPEPVQRLAIRLLVALSEARPWLALGLDEDLLRAATATSPGDEPDRSRLYRLAAAPWTEESDAGSVTSSRASFALLDRIDREYLAYGTAVALNHVGKALAELQAAGTFTVPSDFDELELDTVVGRLRITGGASTVHERPATIAIDLGGDDLYCGAHAVPASLQMPGAVLVDLGGNDVYDGLGEEAAMATGLFGLGLLLDLGGDDDYRTAGSGLGSAWYGTGILYDRAGDDRYHTRGSFGQGAAHAGVGLLLDLAGNDLYECGQQSQGMGSTLGAGVLVDVEGNDRYVARDDGNVSALYLGQSVAMSQGVGFGRRADIGDGHSLAGGVGVLVDGAGDDLYHAQVWAQGAGYWWAVGILEDLGGDDVYENGKYSLGAAAHFAVGSQVDLSGDDRYNVGSRTAVNQFQGHGRDGSIGVSIDGDGDDQYLLTTHCGGSADLGSLALFWDRRGDDCYEFQAPALGPAGSGAPPPLGSATRYDRFRSFRDELTAVGVFLDTQGKDDYRGIDAARDGGRWIRQRDARSWGIGIDGDRFEAAVRSRSVPGPR